MLALYVAEGAHKIRGVFVGEVHAQNYRVPLGELRDQRGKSVAEATLQVGSSFAQPNPVVYSSSIAPGRLRNRGRNPLGVGQNSQAIRPRRSREPREPSQTPRQ